MDEMLRHKAPNTRCAPSDVFWMLWVSECSYHRISNRRSVAHNNALSTTKSRALLRANPRGVVSTVDRLPLCVLPSVRKYIHINCITVLNGEPMLTVKRGRDHKLSHPLTHKLLKYLCAKNNE